jgi:hypothetical protein
MSESKAPLKKKKALIDFGLLLMRIGFSSGMMTYGLRKF